MDATKISALLGRPLSTYETTNFDLYLKIARESLDDLLCMRLCNKEATRVFDVREGYSTAFIDVFTSIDEVKLDGEVVAEDDYSIRQWDRRSGSWYNSIVFECRMTSINKEIEVTGEWGFGTMPVDLQSLLAGLFDQITKKNKLDPSITQKNVEDFRIWFQSDVDLDAEFSKKYANTINKYSLCSVPYLLHGKVC